MKKIGPLLFLLISLLLVFPALSKAQIVINEVSPVSDPEWVEIYNISSDSASLKDFSIDFGSDNQKKIFCDENIAANGYILILLTSRWLNNDGDVITLRHGDDIVDSIGYGSGYSWTKPHSGTESITRYPDGGDTWILTSQQSQQGNIISFDCPTAVPTPTPIQTPTLTPTSAPTLTPIPTLKAVKSPTPIPTKTPSPTQSPLSTDIVDNSLSTDSGVVLAMEEHSSSPAPTPLGLSVSKSKNLFIALSFVFVGLILIGGSFYLAYKTSKTLEDKNNI